MHKYRDSRNDLKGLYDQYGPGQRILVTRSPPLNLYRFGGDSPRGRHCHLRLHPLSFAKLGARPAARLICINGPAGGAAKLKPIPIRLRYAGASGGAAPPRKEVQDAIER